jgi:putative thioredoxin
VCSSCWRSSEFADQAAGAGDTEGLEARIAANADDLDARLALANRLVARQHYAPALDQLLEIVHRDRNFRGDIGRKTILSVFNLLGGQGDIVSRYRRLLASALN